MFDNLRKISVFVNASMASLSGYSEDYKSFINSGFKCLNCNNLLYNGVVFLNANCYSKDGSKITKWATSPDRDPVLKCGYCGHIINMYSKSNSNKLEVVGILETHISEDIVGEESKIINNSRNSSSITQTVTFQNEYSKKHTIQYEKTLMNGREFNLNLKFPEIELASIKITSQETFKKQYSISEETKESRTENIQVTVPPYEKLKITLICKHFCQHGFIKFRKQNIEFDIPFKVVRKIEYEQEYTST